jgi:hypothetical protein
MIKIPITVLLSVVLFIITAGILLLMFGSPECNALANTTAFHLRNAISDVSKDTFPSWDGGGIPPDEETKYYRAVPITLCQDKAIGVIDIVLGTTLEPQYQIYYEKFPESGGGIWTEAYPWSGGAASSVRMWAVMRGVSFGLKITNAALIAKSLKYVHFMNWLGSLGHKLRLAVLGQEIDNLPDAIKAWCAEEGLDPKQVEWYIRGSNLDAADKNLQQALQEGLLSQDPNFPGSISVYDGKTVLSNEPMPMRAGIPVPDATAKSGVSEFQAEIYMKTDSSGKMIDMSTDITDGGKVFKQFNNGINPVFQDGWNEMQARPAEMYNYWLSTLDTSSQAAMREIYISYDDIPVGGLVSHAVEDTNFYKKYFKPLADKAMAFINKIDLAGYRAKKFFISDAGVTGMKNGLGRAVLDTTPSGIIIDGVELTKGEAVSRMILEQDGMTDFLRMKTGLAEASQITNEKLAEFLDEMPLKGWGFVPNELEWGAESQLIKALANEPSPIYNFQPMFAEAFGYDTATNQILDPEKFKVIQDIATDQGLSVPDAYKKMYDMTQANVWYTYQEVGGDEATLTGGSLYSYLVGANDPDFALANRLSNGDTTAAKQVGLFVGLVQQNKDVLPMTKVGYLRGYMNLEVRKLIYLDGPQNLLNPTSFYSKALLANIQTQNCEGNSMCLYTYATQLENPYYLDESAQNFAGNIRVWRPIEWWKNYLGLQAGLQRVPENPRFYVVSPCLARGKVWKTTYYGNPAIFVYPDKTNVNGTASNYCYADSDLVNTYTEIWAASDALTLVQFITGIAAAKVAAKAAQGAVKLAQPTITQAVKNSFKLTASNVIDMVDPVTLCQGIAEGFVSWPGWPFQQLTWETIRKYASSVGIKEIQTGKEEFEET